MGQVLLFAVATSILKEVTFLEVHVRIMLSQYVPAIISHVKPRYVVWKFQIL